MRRAACGHRTVEVSDPLSLSNGNFFNKRVEDSFYGPSTNMVCAAQPPYIGCVRRQIPVVNTGIDCSRPMNSTHSVVGFVQVVVLKTNANGKDASIDVYIDCKGRSAGPPGCASFGLGTRNVRLVK